MSANDTKRALNRLVELQKQPTELSTPPVKDPIPASAGLGPKEVAQQPGRGLTFPLIILERHYKVVTITGPNGCEFDVQEDQRYKVRDGSGHEGWIDGFGIASAIDVTV